MGDMTASKLCILRFGEATKCIPMIILGAEGPWSSLLCLGLQSTKA